MEIGNVAIIIPVLARKGIHVQMLDRCLQSVQGQAGETLVWSDGSDDMLSPQFHALMDKHRWVKFTFAGHNGKSVSRNSAVRDSLREAIYPVDADDELRPRAVQTLVEHWDGTPLYSDLIKVHDDGAEEIYPLPDFDCDAMQNKCISSVNVLHLKEQWEAVGGWNPEFNLLEDWEYNARLFWMFGGRRIAAPLVKYHLHDEQHTRTASAHEKQTAIYQVKMVIRDYVKEHQTMGCCGKKRTGTSKASRTAPAPTPLSVKNVATPVELQVDPSTMGIPNPGYVWARYVGGRGMGKHDKRGMNSRKKYMRVQYAGVYQVKAEDAVTPEQFRAGAKHGGFVKLEPVQRTPPPPPPPPPPVAQASSTAPKEAVRTPVRVERVPMDKALTDYVDTMSSMTVSELKHLLDEVSFGPDELQGMIDAEKAAKGRIGAVKLLEKYLARLSS